MTPEELAERKPVWIAFSDLFLDTDVRLNYVSMAFTASQSPYRLAELKEILEQEVAPALEFNLLDIAGEWAMFDEEWVVQHVLSTAEAMTSPHVTRFPMDEHWKVLSHLVTMLRSLPDPEEQKRLLNALHKLMWIYLSSNPPAANAKPGDLPPEDLERIFRQQLWPLLIGGCRRLAAGNPGVYPTEQEIEANWEALRLTIQARS